MTVVPDFSAARFTGAQLRGWGYTDVIRYACAGRDNVNISRAEADDFKARGIRIGITVEHEANWLLGNPSQVKDRVAGAVAVCNAAGIPNPILLCAVDFDVTLGGAPVSQQALDNCHAMLAGLQAGAEVVGSNIGCYGGYYCIDWLVHNSWIGHYWQTVAWSYGHTHPNAALVQDRVGQSLGGVPDAVDYSTIYKQPWGYSWTPQAPVPPPPAPPSPAGVNVKAIQTAVHATADGVWGPVTDRNCELVRHAPHVSIVALQQYALGFTGKDVDGIAGNKTVLATLAAIQGVQRGLGVAADGIWGAATDAAYMKASPYR